MQRAKHRPSPLGDGNRLHAPAFGYLLLALLLAAGGLGFILFGAGNGGDIADPPPRGALAADIAAAKSPAQPSTTTPSASPLMSSSATPQERDADPTRDLSHYVTRGQKPTLPEVLERLHQAGIHEGLGAFQPPGTRPPLVGLAVPEDFALPEGYVRHYQATDDGQRIEAILMFAPDRQFVDSAKRPIPVPKNRVVPPEYAPPGLPIRRIAIPKPLDPDAK